MGFNLAFKGLETRIFLDRILKNTQSIEIKPEIGTIYAKKSANIILLLCTRRGCSDDLRYCAVGTIIRGLILSFTFMKR